MSAEIQHRRGTTAQWASAVSPDGKLSEGEIGIDTDLNQVKVGPPSGTPTAWGSIPWLGGTLPYFASPNSDLNDASNRIDGRYRFTSVTNGPAAPIDIKAADGGINMVVLTFGTTVVQQLWTDGDGGTQVPKSYTRVYDGDVPAWRDWTPQNLWGVSATEGVNASVRSLTVKENATVEGDLSINGNTNIGNASTDIAVFQAGNASAPSQTFAGDLDTGAYSPAANEWGVATGGAQRVHVTNALTTIRNSQQIDGNFKLVGSLVDVFNCGGQFLTNLANPNTPAGALNWQTLLTHLAFVGPITANGTVVASNGQNWTVTNFGTTPTITPPAGNWDGLVMSFAAGGNAEPARSRTQNNVTAFSPAASGSNWLIVIAVRRS